MNSVPSCRSFEVIQIRDRHEAGSLQACGDLIDEQRESLFVFLSACQRDTGGHSSKLPRQWM